jgi:DNA-directed RNA polymerase subunit omega
MANMPQLILAKDVDSKFRFITVAAQRAKQLQNGAKPRVEARSRKPTRIAMQEVLAEAVSWEIRDEKEMAAAASAEIAAANEAAR